MCAAYLNWTGSAGTDTAILSNQIQLLMEPLLRTIYPELDEFMRGLMITSEGVVRGGREGQFSRDWKIRKPFVQGLAGTVNMDTDATVYGPAVTDIGDNQYQHSKDNLGTYPDPFEGALPVPAQIEITLRGLKASLPWPIAEDDLEALPAVIGPNYARMMQAWARQIALYRIGHFYAMSDVGKICDITIADISATETYSDPNGSLRLTVPSKAINNFHRGMQVDIYEGSDQRNLNTANARVPIYVQSVDHFKNEIKLVYNVAAADSGASGSTGIIEAEGVGDTDVIGIYLRASYGDVYPGLNTYCKATHITDSTHANYIGDSGTFFGVTMSQYPHQSSLVVDAENNYLTEILASSALAEFMDGHGSFGQDLDTCILRRGAHVGYLKARRGLEVLNRQGSNTAALGGGTQGVKGGFAMTFDGLTVTGYYSTYLREGTMFFLKRGDNNFKRYVPPMAGRSQGGKPPGFGDGDGMINSMELEFMGRRLGHASEFVPVYGTNTNPVDAVQMIARSRMTVVPDQFAMVKIENVAEVSPTKVVA